MGMEIQLEAFDVRGPKLTKTHVIAVTNVSQNTDMSASASVGPDVLAGRTLRLQAEGCDVYYAWGPNNSGTIDDTATGTGATVCGVIPVGQFRDERPPLDTGVATAPSPNQKAAWVFLYFKAAGSLSGKLRVTVASQDATAAFT